MSNNKKISVIVPTYNRGSLIKETISKVIDQTIQPFEIIVINDGSSDDTLDVLSCYGNKIIIKNIMNSGDLVARNTGLLAASGDLVAFCDSDDLWQPNHLNLMARFWDEPDGPIAAYADFQEVRDERWGATTKFSTAPARYWDDLRPIGTAHFLFERPIVKDLMRFQPFFPSCMVVDRARFLALGGWDEGVSRMVGCDFATTLRLAEHPPMGVLREPTVGIRKHAGNFSGDVQRMNLGDADVLEYTLATRPSLAPYAVAMGRSIEARRLAAFDTAFATGDFAAVQRIDRLLNAEASLSRRVKSQVARLPVLVRAAAWSGLTWLSGRRADRTRS
ncbi:MAG: glycosyltransferase [Acidiphilium sp.]|nr:glycosyltransferase [Acidiphilium sp.]MDD4935325.1 glycosyltransferase [Acidiphilium sp.]